MKFVSRPKVGVEEIGINDGVGFAFVCAPNVRRVKRHAIHMLRPFQTVRPCRHEIFERAWIDFADRALLVAQKSRQSGVIGSFRIGDVDGVADSKAGRDDGCTQAGVAVMEILDYLFLECGLGCSGSGASRFAR